MSQIWNIDVYDKDARAAHPIMEDIEKMLETLRTSFSGSAAPSNTIAGLWWFDTTANILKLRNEANTAWLSVWDLANNKPVIVNLSDEITVAMVASSAKDPAAGTAGLRTIGTTALAACSGADSRLSTVPDNYVHIGKVQHGSIMLPHYMSEDDTEVGVAASVTWQDHTVKKFRVYIPADATTIRMAVRVKCSSANTFIRFNISTLNSNGATVTTSWVWITSCILDVSSLSGWYDLKIQHYATTSYTTTIQGLSFIWE